MYIIIAINDKNDNYLHKWNNIDIKMYKVILYN